MHKRKKILKQGVHSKGSVQQTNGIHPASKRTEGKKTYFNATVLPLLKSILKDKYTTQRKHRNLFQPKLMKSSVVGISCTSTQIQHF